MDGMPKLDDLDPETRKTMEQLGLAPYAVFLLVAAADGDVEEKEFKAFVNKLGDLKSPVLKVALMVTGDPMAALKRLMAEKDLIKGCLEASAKFIRKEMLDGPAVRTDLVGLARAIAESNASRAFLGLFGAKKLRESEEMAVRAIESMLTK